MKKVHACLLCACSFKFEKPISMTTGEHLHLSFSCCGCKEPNSYDGIHSGINDIKSMIYDFVTEECWVDGCCSIPNQGCSGFELYKTVNKELIRGDHG